jgi:hypothetical protein
MGHLYGLWERYSGHVSGFGTCNNSPNESVIMDTMTGISIFDERWRHCDFLNGPSAKDRERVDAYWGQGRTAAWLNHPAGSTLAFSYEDLGWAEFEHWVNWFWFSGQDWETAAAWIHSQNIGAHNSYGPRRITTPAFDRAQSDWPPGYYVGCAAMFFAAYSELGETNCGTHIWVP